jgi:hypothetical protein
VAQEDYDPPDILCSLYDDIMGMRAQSFPFYVHFLM